jgi:RimJ/RimL family protein N-acetyltransferase
MPWPEVLAFLVMDDCVSLRPVAEDELPLLYRLTSDPAATGEHEWFGYQDPARFRRQWADNGLLGENDGMLIAAVNDEPIGFVSWRKRATARTSYCWNIGIAISPEARGRGYGTQAQRQLVRYLFAHTQVNRIEAGTEIANVAEQRALEKAGFTREGVVRGGSFQGGRWHDGVLYSILRDEVNLHEHAD